MSNVTVSTRYGQVRGHLHEGVASFLGIPYAAPPFGVNRMRPPRTPEPWSGVRDALVHGPSAPQPGYAPAMAGLLTEAGPQGEDCLNLNVWTPSPHRSSEGLPVMVWIHGGAFRNGSGSLPTYDGSVLARDGVVCVTLNYRLGAEGFLLLPDGTANLGLMDQIAALEWVRDNIAAFGGDPGNVTVFGQSAGAISITALMAMPRAEGLFRRAITQSGAGHHAHTPETARRITERLAALVGAECTVEALAAVPSQDLAAANSRLAQEIARSTDPGQWGESAGGGTTVLPVAGTATLPERPVDAIAAGAGRGLDLLTGVTAEEFRLFLVPLGMADHIDDGFLHGFLDALGLEPVTARAVYAEARPQASAADLFSAVMTDHGYRLPAVRIAEARAAHGADTYFYEFTQPSPALDGSLGACHMAELGPVFGNPHDPLTDTSAHPLLSERIRGAWTSFAHHGRPTSGHLPPWPAYLPGRSVMFLDATAPAVRHDPARPERLLWDGLR
ncbi:carboxylesterase/lipase family protein [Kitasatospora sp. NPDC101235]|uniref:carboxylesterase/lipase family protein n=1 Tax=Kitasatospora sp. NPDC101235 TaxID=3364101 RepID=UPI003818B1C1